MAKNSHKLLRILFVIVMSVFMMSGMTSLFFYSAQAQTAKNLSSKNGLLSFDFQDIEIRTLLQLIASRSNLNFIISDSVKGNVTLTLKDVTWQQALSTILESHGLASRQVGNVIYISTIEDITDNESKELQSAETLSSLGPLISTIVHLKYANATDVASLLKGAQSQLLSSRGQVAPDPHTNSIIIRDVSSNVQQAVKMITQLDVPAKQVLIEARIVSINVQFEKDIGAMFGLSKPSYLSGQFFGANSLAQGTSLPNVTNSTGTIDPTQRLNFNNPASTIFGGNPGSIAVAVAKVGGSYLDLQLSALEGENKVQIISTPRVMTSNQQKAVIATGTEIPYEESTSSGATSVDFKDALLSLTITPQITPDNKIILAIDAHDDTPGTNTVVTTQGTTQSTSIPSIDTSQVSSNVVLNNNETAVLGGIYTHTKQLTMQRIPVLGEIPFIGALFRHTLTQDQKTELLIFITPKIIASTDVVNYKSRMNSNTSTTENQTMLYKTAANANPRVDNDNAG